MEKGLTSFFLATPLKITVTKEVYTRPEYRNQGLPTELVSLLAEEIVDSERIRVLVENNFPAARAYEKLVIDITLNLDDYLVKIFLPNLNTSNFGIFFIFSS